jgi:hypothetical protein
MLGAKPKPTKDSKPNTVNTEKVTNGNLLKPTDRLKPKTVDLVRLNFIKLIF